MFDHKHLIALLSGALLLHLAPKLLNIFQAIQQKRLPHTEKIVPEQKKKLARLSKVLMTEVLLPNMADAYGVAISGVLISWMDIAAGIAAKRHAGMPCVTASVDAVHFLRPVYVGEAVVLKATVNKSWKTSMEIGVHVEAENLETGDRRYCCHAYLTFVALQEGKPAIVPLVISETPEEYAAAEAAEERRQQRFKTRQRDVVDAVQSPTEATPGREEEEAKRDQPFIPKAAFQFPVSIGKAATTDGHVPTSQSYTQTVQILMPQHANSLHVTFGGHIIRRMEECALIAASRHLHFRGKHHKPVVFRNASIDSLSFKRPTKVGDVLIVRGYVSRVWKSSLEVYISVHTATTSYNDAWNKQVLSIEDAVDHDNSFEFTNDGYMTFVALQGGNEEETTSLDESHPSLKFIELPPIKPLTDIEIWRHETAITRREARLSGRQQLTGESHQTSIEIAP